MMYPPIFKTCFADNNCKTALGSNPMRLYLFGEAPQKVALPYAVWQTIGGSPENFLGDLPDMDMFSVQVDVYAATPDSARSAALALRDAIEPVAHITSWRGESTEPETLLKRYSFDVDWFTPR